MKEIKIAPITAAAFAPYGDVIEVSGTPDKIINQGLCGRFHDRARLDFGTDGRAGISLFQAELRALPLTLDLVERHPDGSQAFLPMSMDGFLVIVAPDNDGTPGMPQAFMTEPGQGINYLPNIWHGVLTPMAGSGLFAVIDRIGETPNLQEFWFDAPFVVTL
jgi:ureidoglycolate lyase